MLVGACPVALCLVSGPAPWGEQACSAPCPPSLTLGMWASVPWDWWALSCHQKPQQKLPRWGGPSPPRIGFVPSADLACWGPWCCQWGVDKAPPLPWWTWESLMLPRALAFWGRSLVGERVPPQAISLSSGLAWPRLPDGRTQA